MAGTLVGVAALFLFIGTLAYAVTLSGREVTYIVPLSVRTEVALGLVFLALAATVLVGAATALVVDGSLGVVAGLAVALVFAAAFARPLMPRWRRDEERVASRRTARAERRKR